MSSTDRQGVEKDDCLPGYYPPDPVKEYTETSEGGNADFLSRLAKDWEQASDSIEQQSHVRRVILRAGKLFL